MQGIDIYQTGRKSMWNNYYFVHLGNIGGFFNLNLSFPILYNKDDIYFSHWMFVSIQDHISKNIITVV